MRDLIPFSSFLPISPLSLCFSWIFSSLPTNKQMLALSATYPESLAQYLSRYMREPTFVRLNPTDPGLIGEQAFLICCCGCFKPQFMH